MNILFLINKLNIGGAETVFVNQANYLAKQNHDVYFGLIFKSQKQSLIDKLEINNDLQYFNFWRLKKFVKQNNIKIIYATLDRANIYARVLKIFLPRVRVVIRESGMADRKTARQKFLDIILNFFTDKIIAVSEEVRQSLIKYQKIHAKKVIVLANGTMTLDQSKIEHDIFTVLNIGSMNNDNKGQGDLIKLMAEIDLKLKLILIGDGALKKDLEGLVKKLNIQDKVFFTGVLNKEEVNKYYLSSDIYILNSKNEGCPNVVLEAMSASLPVIATRVGGVSEIIEDQKSGFLVDRGDYDTMKALINRLYQDKNFRADIGQEAKIRAQNNFDFKKQTDKLIKILSYDAKQN